MNITWPKQFVLGDCLNPEKIASYFGNFKNNWKPKISDPKKKKPEACVLPHAQRKKLLPKMVKQKLHHLLLKSKRWKFIYVTHEWKKCCLTKKCCPSHDTVSHIDIWFIFKLASFFLQFGNVCQSPSLAYWLQSADVRKHLLTENCIWSIKTN